MGLIILFIVISTILAFSAGNIVAVGDSSDNDSNVLAFVVAMFLLIVSVGLPISAIYSYVEKTKEYSSTKYSLKKKVITIEEDSTVKLDTIYTFTHK